MTDQYAVIGNPIAHSKSPLIHAAFARQTGQRMEYGRILGNPDGFAADVRAFVAAGGRGLNVTVPFKETAFALLAELSPRALAAGAVNTISVHDGGLLAGDNTDGVGLMRDLTDNHGVRIADARVLLVGAGGAARGVLGPLLAAGPAVLLLANRTAARAESLVDLVRRFNDRATSLTGGGLDRVAGQRFDLIINATASGLTGAVPDLPGDCLADGGVVYDLLYADTATPFCTWGAAHGAARCIDGLGMLVEQAAESFAIWRGVRPETGPVIRELRGTQGPRA